MQYIDVWFKKLWCQRDSFPWLVLYFYFDNNLINRSKNLHNFIICEHKAHTNSRSTEMNIYVNNLTYHSQKERFKEFLIRIIIWKVHRVRSINSYLRKRKLLILDILRNAQKKQYFALKLQRREFFYFLLKYLWLKLDSFSECHSLFTKTNILWNDKHLGDFLDICQWENHCRFHQVRNVSELSSNALENWTI